MLVQEDRQPHYRVSVRDLELVTEVARSRKGEGRVRNRRHPQSQRWCSSPRTRSSLELDAKQACLLDDWIQSNEDGRRDATRLAGGRGRASARSRTSRRLGARSPRRTLLHRISNYWRNLTFRAGCIMGGELSSGWSCEGSECRDIINSGEVSLERERRCRHRFRSNSHSPIVPSTDTQVSAIDVGPAQRPRQLALALVCEPARA